MRYVPRMRAALQALVLAALAPNAFAEAPPRTMITVVTADWDATTGELRRWEREGRSWRQVGAPIAIVIGKSGLKSAADKREGDGASPAGRFALGEATGYESAPKNVRLPYRIATAALRCVDDPGSPQYNMIAEAPASGAPWKSDEKMRRDDQLYRYTIFVKQNESRTPGQGSCVFLHVWRGPTLPTVGCTAMARTDLRAILTWAAVDTILVQLPRKEYERRQREWDLPAIQRK